MADMRLRFPPSPTGKIHVGNIRTALFNWLWKEKNEGELVLRIEDTDTERSTQEFEEIIIQELDWLGIEADEGVEIGGDYGPYRQSERGEIYQEHIDRLLEEDKAYRCYCSEEEIKEMREAQKARGEIPHYDGRCRDKNLSPEERPDEYAVRFKMPEKEEEIVVEDQIRGRVSFDSGEFDDFVIQKSNGIPTYNFAVVIDDALMEITDVIRGEDHLSNTPKQIMLYEALDFSLPRFAHLPLILSEDGSKLKKRSDSDAVYVGEFREQGYLPEALVNFLALLGWSPGAEREIMDREDLIEEFEIGEVKKGGAIFDREKLNWMNNHYIKEADLDRIMDLGLPFLQEADLVDDDVDEEWFKKVLDIVRDGLDNLAQLPDEAELFLSELTYEDENKARELFDDEEVQEVLNSLRTRVENCEELDEETVSGIFSEVQEETGVGGRKFYHPLRYALTGKDSGPSLGDFLALLGRSEALSRLERAIKLVG
ncbi:glutamate--tRNA ligase [Halarsenatibacter silvermanii]|uniref:Glutamate--tRNA ligase n=1 Tax=Halarsenatibacter silvermanii TaxID=321763 RepID=A0A1G9SYN7_9FIRM|nr:glutamate--tRNA ligase [Halarsenatibacter silvermanii]SDM40437.1 nondiscriminating glutamyl-tRNA synthetase [Halarsenatibacter silvermanii]